jgi:uncharacterized membrane protein SpoIIM required for sporulation
MVLESIFHTSTLLQNKFLLLVYTAFVTIISATVSYIFYKNSASILTIAFITFAFMYFLIKVYYNKEKEILSKETSFFKRYIFVIEVYVKIFIVVSIIFTAMYVFLPQDYRDVIFKEQAQTLSNVGQLRDSINMSGNLYLNSPGNLFLYIFLNNLGVLFAILLFAFLYGVGSLFIIVYQASVFGTVVGTKILSLVPQYIGQGVYGQVIAVLHGSLLGLGLLPHGIFELFAYFLAAVVGGIVSAILHGHYIEVRKNLQRVILDLSIILGVAIICLLIGALIEAHIILG